MGSGSTVGLEIDVSGLREYRADPYDGTPMGVSRSSARFGMTWVECNNPRCSMFGESWTSGTELYAGQYFVDDDECWACGERGVIRGEWE